MHVTFCEEGLRGGAAAVDDFREVADGLGEEAGVEGGEGRRAPAEEELYVAEELCDVFKFSEGCARWGRRSVAGERDVC